MKIAINGQMKRMRRSLNGYLCATDAASAKNTGSSTSNAADFRCRYSHPTPSTNTSAESPTKPIEPGVSKVSKNVSLYQTSALIEVGIGANPPASVQNDC